MTITSCSSRRIFKAKLIAPYLPILPIHLDTFGLCAMFEMRCPDDLVPKSTKHGKGW